MAIGINDLDEENLFGGEEPTEESPKETEQSEQIDNQESSTTDEDVLTTLLKEKGIVDPNKVKFENEDGEIEEVPFSELDREEQLNILKESDKVTTQESDDLDDEEINLLNHIRTQYANPQEFIDSIKRQAIQEFTEYNNQPSYQIDDLTDDELYILDLTSKVQDLSEQQASEALDRAKQDEDLYNKQVNGLRSEYKALEDSQRSQEELSKQAEDEEQYQQFTDSIVGTITNLNKIGNLDIELTNDDQNEIANFILSKDEAGMSYFAKALNDPNALVQMAWFALHGQDSIDQITDYFTEQIKQVSKSRYNQGLKDAQEGKKPATKRVVVGSNYVSNVTPKKLSIDDLD